MLPSSTGISPSKLFLNRYTVSSSCNFPSSGGMAPPRFPISAQSLTCSFDFLVTRFPTSLELLGSKELVVWWPSIGVLGRGSRKSVLKCADCSPPSKLFEQAGLAGANLLLALRENHREMRGCPSIAKSGQDGSNWVSAKMVSLCPVAPKG
ncbi:hypothetical protein Taro_013476 [Colocasia esculenta]|uniref:Uncharacterized protein n=1 Tax=Colocasia esculenta TaxID=4460 RepID=A0A843UG31_COLES|nr:hypothetical protein [Colocasia esculenta]